MENLAEILGVIIVLSPIVIFIFSMLIIRKSLAGNKITTTDFLSETEIILKQQENTNQQSNTEERNNAQQGDNAEQTPPVKRSASRLILFLSGITSLILAVCITTYYFYMNIYCINCKSDMDLADFVNVILALGIGVVPYAVNQVKRIRL